MWKCRRVSSSKMEQTAAESTTAVQNVVRTVSSLKILLHFVEAILNMLQQTLIIDVLVDNVRNQIYNSDVAALQRTAFTLRSQRGRGGVLWSPVQRGDSHFDAAAAASSSIPFSLKSNQPPQIALNCHTSVNWSRDVRKTLLIGRVCHQPQRH
ncbi:hypothetical protein C0J52_02231 [Blattella germanica]|nr:hypothetical protein C0J52_02231 [Blattella germanica]